MHQLESGVHLDWFDNTDNMMDKIRYYLENEEKRQLIATQGCQLVHEKYSWDKIIQNVLDIVQKERTKGDDATILTNEK